MWGGAGALWEVADLGEDRCRYWGWIVALAGEMEEQGVGTERTREISETLAGWIAAGTP